MGRAFPAKEALCTGINFEVNDDQVARKHARVEGVILEVCDGSARTGGAATVAGM